jgi:hypothetical protein
MRTAEDGTFGAPADILKAVIFHFPATYGSYHSKSSGLDG